MSARQLLAELRRRDIALWAEDGQLRYRGPKGALTAELRAAVKEHRAELLSRLLAAESAIELEPTSRDGTLPLSYGQEQLWFLDQLHPGTTAYLARTTLRLRGEVDTDALRRALDDIVERHEVLSSTFVSTGGKPEVRVGQGGTSVLQIESLDAVPAPDRLAEAQRRAAADGRRPVDLARGPLLRVTLFAVDRDDWVFYLATHHIVWDAWSWMVFFRELTQLYDARRAGRPSPLPDLQVGYVDYARWQRQRFESGAMSEQLGYWRDKLRGLPLIDLPGDRPRPAKPTQEGGAERVALPAELAEQLLAASQEMGASPYHVLLAAFFVLLRGQTGTDDLPVGTPVNGRPHHRLQELLGLFVNWVVIRGDLTGNPPFRDLVGRVQRTALEAIEHEEVPFEKVVEKLAPPRIPGRNPLFDVLFNYLDSSGVGDIESSLQLTPLRDDGAAAPPSALFDLTMVCNRDTQGIEVGLQYRTALFDRARMLRLLEQYVDLLGSAVGNPGLRLSELGGPPAIEKAPQMAPIEAATVSSPAAAAEPEGGFDLLGMLDQAFAAFEPDTALISGAREIAFGEVDAKSHGIAGALLARGLSRGDRVIVCLRDRPQIIASMLGVWRAGGVFVPLDPDGPEDRLAWISAELQPACLLVEASDRERVEELGGEALADASTIELAAPDAAEWCGGAALEANRSASGLRPHEMAYVYYTSGSTGRPKGIAGTLRGLAHFVLWEIDTFGLGRGTRVSQLTVPTFDAFFRDVLVPLCCGGTICVPPDPQRLDPLVVLDWLDERGVRLVHCVPSLFATLAAVARQPDSLRSLEWVLMSGEVIPLAAVRDWRQLFGDRIRLVNLYGPTETTMVKLFHVVQAADVERGFIPIGKPMRGARAVLLDEDGRVRLRGTVGEMYLRTPYRTLGYYGDPEQTHAVFVPNPLGKNPDDLVYKTGDLCRVLEDGSFQFVGRVDNQVKIRGVRVELEEIEAALRAHPGVAAAGAVARADDTGDLQLVAYVVPSGGAIETAELSAFLAARLPAQMVPAALVTLEELPRTPNGKLDRKALPDPGAWQTAAAAEYVEPRTASEKIVARIWEEILGLQRAGRDDDFFQLGGHSLRAVQVVVRLRDLTQTDVPLRALFEHRTLAALAGFLDESAGGTATEASIERAPPGELTPLSFAQHRLWVLDQLDPGSHAYVMASAVRLRGALDTEALRRGLDAILGRHEVLRTRIRVVGGEPKGELAADARFPLELMDLSELPTDEREKRAAAVISERRRQPFDLASDTLVRGVLIRLAEAEHVLVWNTHHIASDAWSEGVFFAELGAHYRAALAAGESSLPELPIQYADYARWQRARMRGELRESQLAYWRERLKGLPPVLELPLDRPRPPVLDYKGSSRSFVLSRDVSDRLGRLSAKASVTPFVVTLAAATVLLHRYTGAADIAVGTPVANRDRRELEGLIGFFINTLVLRVDLAGDPTFTELLERVQETVLGALAHQDLPFEELVVAVQPERSLNRNPLFQVSFTFHNEPLEVEHLPGLTLAQQESTPEACRFDLEFHVGEVDGRLHGAIRYATGLFDAATIDYMIGHYVAMLSAVAAAPDTAVSALPMIAAEERRWLLAAPDDPAMAERTAAPVDWCLHGEFERQVARAPDAVAVTFGDDALSYRDLNARANQLARLLRERGVGPGVLVGMSVERGFDLTIAIVGITKSGGAYVAIDPANPVERIAFMLKDAGVRLLVTEKSVLERLPSGGVEAILMDGDRALLQQQSAENLEANNAPEDLAYVIYTSGSTGTPKGVCVEHRNVVRLFTATQHWFAFDDRDVWPLFHSSAFDLSVWEVWGALLHGGRLVVVPHAVTRAPDEFWRLLRDQRVTVLTQTPSAFRPLMRADLAPDAQGALALRLVVFAGEALDIPSLRPWFERHGDQQPLLVNMYGITETTVHSTYRVISMRDVAAAPGSMIGVPIPDLLLRVLDEKGRLVPVGVPGELYVSGPGVARGYLGREALTAERFVDDPFEPGTRSYRSGDLVRRMSNGDIEYLGRLDDQVKIRGYRIELGEIASVLRQHPRVGDAAVLVRSYGPGDDRLVAYLTPPSGGEVGGGEDAGALREAAQAWVRQRLPESMVPAAIVLLETLPLTSNGKLDRRALPDPGVSDHGVGAAREEFEAPRTAVELVLAKLWSEALRVERVGIHDNFFELGGDSILALRIVAAANEAGVAVTPRQMFEQQTVADLAAVAKTRVEVTAEQGAVVGDIPLTPIQRWFFERDLIDAHHANQSVLLAVGESVDSAVVRRAVQRLLEHHDALRSRFDREGGEWRQRIVAIDDAGDLPFETVDLSALPSAERPAAIEARASETQASLDLANGPLLRAVWFDSGADEPALLLLAIHHLVVDGVSWQILLGDLQRLCRDGAGLSLPEKTSSYLDWAVRLRDAAGSPATRGRVDAWAGLPWDKVAALPVDHVATADANTIATVGELVVSLDEEETTALLRVVPRAYRTQINDALLAALVMAMAPWTGRSALLIDLEGHGREDLEGQGLDVSRTVGWFTSIYPVVLQVEGAETGAADPGAALMSIKEQLRAVPDRGISYGVTRYLASPDAVARLAALPAPEISFNYFGQQDQVLGEASAFAAATESAGLVNSGRHRRAHMIDVLGNVAGGKLRIGWVFSRAIHDAATIEAVAERYLAALRQLIEHGRQPAARGFTPSDFPRADLDQGRLAEIEARCGHDAIEDLLELSPMQRGLVFHSMSERGTGVYVEHVRFTAERIEPAAFRQAWQAVVDRHTALRTGIIGAGGKAPLQLVHRRVVVPITEHDCRSMTEAAQETWLRSFMESDARRGFDLAEPPLMRLALVRLGEDRHEIVWTQHHLILDGWSVAVVVDEFSRLYRALLSGEPRELPPAPGHGDHIAWLRRQDLAAAEAYWRGALAGFEVPTAVGSLRAAMSERSAVPDYQSRELELAPALVEGLEKLAAEAQVTLNTVMLGAWSLLLGAHSGEEDVVFGTTVAGRPAELRGVQSMVGLLINTLPLRVRIADEVVVTWLRQLQSLHAEQIEFQYGPLWKVQQWSEVPAGTPLFDILYVFENYPSLHDSPAEKRTGSARIKQERTGYPLALCINPRVGLVVRLNYDRARLDEATIAAMLQHYQNLLEGMVASPQKRLRELAVLGEAERHRLLVEWNDTRADLPPVRCVHRMFEQQVARQPAAAAVVHKGEELSYRELEARANQLAWTLRAMGVGPDTMVGLCVERGIDMVVGWLGILKAGGAYVPLDPSYPASRLAFMLTDSRVRVLVTEEHLLPTLPDHRALVFCMDRDRSRLAAAASKALPNLNKGSSPCYMIYTSGSTGQPKGAVSGHEGLCNVAMQQQRAFGVGPGSRVLQFASLSFDASAFEIVMALLSGATLYLGDREALRPGPDLLAFLSANAISIVTLPPSALAVMPEHPLPALKVITVAGEACAVDLVERWATGRRFFNLYGPTEATIWSTVAELVPGERTVHIGRPIGNVTAFVVDRHLRPVPFGAPGELCVGGIGVGVGYHGRPELERERFVSNPFGDGRLYRTGDLVRHRADGNLEFLGRIDHQVKLRGYRIETGEIEAVLDSHPRVRTSVVVKREDVPGDPRLIAYAVPELSGVDPTESSDKDEHVGQWRELYDDTYSGPSNGEAAFDIAGWNSSFTGEPIPADEMREWVDRTVSRVLETRPERVLELGCGTGLLLLRIAPHCQRYVGTDFSKAAIDQVSASLPRVDTGSCEIELEQCRADELDVRHEGRFDTVIANSVVQYFPSLDYLGKVIEAAVGATRPGGRIFVGDVRSLPLLWAFHSAVGIARAVSDFGAGQLLQRVHRAVNRDQELVIDPAFFEVLGDRLPRITYVEIAPKRGRYDNELSRFRYDVTLHLDGSEGEVAAVTEWRDWVADELTVPALRGLLEAGPDEVAVRGVPDQRTLAAVRMASLLRENACATAADVQRGAEADSERMRAVQPQDLWDLGEDLSYDVDLSLRTSCAGGAFDAVFLRRGSARRRPLLDRRPAIERVMVEDLANDPMRARQLRDVVPQLRAYAQQELPEHMVPAAFVLLDALPLTPNRKVDRRALPAPDDTALDLPYTAPRTPLEEKLAAIWAEVLQLERVGVHQDFFELGGHSLNVTQVTSRVREELGREIAIQAVFEDPTVAGLAERIGAAVGGAAVLSSIAPVPRTAPLALSSAQKRLWFLEQIMPGSGAYGVALALEMIGPLDRAALERTFVALIERHETLRTRFSMVDGDPVQIIEPSARFDLPVIDLRSQQARERTRRADEMVSAARAPVFDLERGPLLRCTLLRMGDEEHRLIIAMHHIITDGWSMGVLARELGALYTAFSEGRSSPLPPLEIQYADFAEWQNRWFGGGVLAEHLAYWRERLGGAAVLELPMDRERSQVETFRGASLVGRVDAGVARSLEEVGRAVQATLFMTAQAAFSALLHRYTGQDDIVVGSPSAGRNHAQIEGLIGFFVNNLVLRTDVSGDPTFRELLRRVRVDTLEAYSHQDVPFEYMVEQLEVGRDPSRHPLFQVAFSAQNTAGEMLHLPGLRLRQIDTGGAVTARYDLEVHVSERRDGLALTFIYNTDLFEASTVRRMMGHFQNLLRAIGADPDQRLSEVDMLSPAERRKLLVENNDTAQPYPTGRCLHDLFEEQVRRRPNAVALVGAGVSMTYAELSARARGQAHELVRLGVRPSHVVGLFVERGPEMVVGMLAILEAGAAYLPLDPALPHERIQFMLDDAGVSTVLTQRDLEAALRAGPERTVVHLEGGGALDAGTARPLPAVHPDDLAYVIYTSGSTGWPKGVQVPHRCAVNFTTSMARQPGITSSGRLLAVTTMSFDIAVLELFLPLLHGACTEIVPSTMALDGNRLRERLDRGGITMMQATPATWQMLIEAGWQGGRGTRILCGGEALSRSLAQDLLSRGSELWNLYGPTETTVWSTIERVQTMDGHSVPIGRGIANTQVYVLDAALQPVAIGVHGELYIGGDGVARGYLGQPALTAERFVPDPFGSTPGRRLYRTGDLVRWRPDGCLEFVGRADMQIKLRGHRIEPGEVEAVAVERIGVQRAVAVVREDRPGDRRLVLYVVAASGETVPDDLRQQLAEHLPKPMVPAAVVVLPSLPLTPSGKVDRSALPAPGAAEHHAAPAHPRTPSEKMLAEVWQEVLGVDSVGLYDNFFDLGGHSLLAVRAITKMRERTGLRVDFLEFMISSLGQIASSYDAARGSDGLGAAPETRSLARRLWASLARLVPLRSR